MNTTISIFNNVLFQITIDLQHIRIQHHLTSSTEVRIKHFGAF